MISCIDSIESPETTGNPIPQAILQAQAIAAYVHGNSWPTYGPYAAARPDLAARGWIISISLRVQGLAQGQARCGDFEQGGMVNSDVGTFLHLADRRWGKPWLYVAASNVQDIINEAGGQGWHREDYYIWSAHYGAGEHICGPGTCGYPQADGTQWTDTVPGNCDGSILQDYMLPGVQPPPLEDQVAISATRNQDGRIEIFVEAKDGSIWHTYQTSDNGPWLGGKPGVSSAQLQLLAPAPK